VTARSGAADQGFPENTDSPESDIGPAGSAFGPSSEADLDLVSRACLYTAFPGATEAFDDAERARLVQLGHDPSSIAPVLAVDLLVCELGVVGVLAAGADPAPVLLEYFRESEAEARADRDEGGDFASSISTYGDPQVLVEGRGWWINATCLDEPERCHVPWQAGHIERWGVHR
jgi:hypothetical protein